MKISKERLKQIIKEELEIVEQEQPQGAPPETKSQEASPETKQQFRDKLKGLYADFPKIQGLDQAEIKLLNLLLMGGLKAAKEGSAKSVLSMAVQKLGVDLDE